MKKKWKWIIGIGTAAAAAVLIAVPVLWSRFGPTERMADLGMVKEGSSEAVSKDEERRQILAVYADDVMGSFNPAYAQSYGDRAVSRIVFEPLMEQDDKGQYQPCLASGVDISKDGLVYTIKLQKKIRFSDGSDMTADDVAASIAAMGLWNSTGEATAAYSNIEGMPDFMENPVSLPSGISSDGEHTVTVQFTNASPDNLMILETQVQKADPEKIAQEVQSKGGIGTGAYQISDTTQGSAATLTANEYYRSKPKDIKTVEFRSMSYYDVPNAVKNSELDVLLYSGTNSLYDTFYDWDGFSVYSEPAETVYALFYNQKNPVLKDKKLRQAISCCFDRSEASGQRLIQSLMSDGGVGPDMKGNEASESYGYDIDRAKALYAEAEKEVPSLASGLKLKLPVVKGNKVHTAMAKLVRDNLKELGIKVTVEEMDQQKYLRTLYMNSDFDLYLSGIPVSGSIASYKNFYQVNGMPVGIEDKTITDAYDKLALSVTQKEVEENGQALYQAIDEAQPALVLGRSRNFISLSADLSGYGISSYDAFLGQINKIKVE